MLQLSPQTSKSWKTHTPREQQISVTAPFSTNTSKWENTHIKRTADKCHCTILHTHLKLGKTQTSRAQCSGKCHCILSTNTSKWENADINSTADKCHCIALHKHLKVGKHRHQEHSAQISVTALLSTNTSKWENTDIKSKVLR